MTEKNWVLYGPQGCGKTLNSKAIAKALGLKHIREAEGRVTEKDARGNDTLIITNARPSGMEWNRRVISYDDAMRLVQGKRH